MWIVAGETHWRGCMLYGCADMRLPAVVPASRSGTRACRQDLEGLGGTFRARPRFLSRASRADCEQKAM